jgi:hypothetical protein
MIGFGFAKNFISNRTLKVAVGNTMSSESSTKRDPFLSGIGHHMQGSQGTDKNPWIRR